jgi:hypothetical protein
MLLIAKPSGFLIGMACGAAIWLLSPILAGRSEPWDAGFYYPVALLVAGLLGGWAAPTHMGRVALGIFLGQGLILLGGVIADPGSGALWPLGIVFLGIYSVVALFGAAIGAAITRHRAASRPD